MRVIPFWPLSFMTVGCSQGVHRIWDSKCEVDGRCPCVTEGLDSLASSISRELIRLVANVHASSSLARAHSVFADGAASDCYGARLKQSVIKRQLWIKGESLVHHSTVF